jgi:hypothetical protein
MTEVLYPILHDADYNMITDTGQVNHNLIGLIQHNVSYTAIWTAPFPRPVQYYVQADSIPQYINMLEDAQKVCPSSVSSTNPSAQNSKLENNASDNTSLDPAGYCSTHGYRVVALHTSQTCKKKVPHHNVNATRVDTKQGSKTNKGWETNPNPM